MFSSKSVHAKLKFFPVNVLGNVPSPSEVVRNLNVWFHLDFTFSCHVRNTYKAHFFILGILSDSEGISHVKLLFWLQTLWLEVVLTTVIPCLEVYLLLTFTGFNVCKDVLLQLLLIPPSIDMSCLLERLFIGCLSSITPFSRLPCPALPRTRTSQSDYMLLQVPHFASIYKSKRHEENFISLCEDLCAHLT